MLPKPPARTLLADDHALVRAGLKQLLEQTGLVTIVAEADDGMTVPDLIAEADVELAVLDISMPQLGGLDLLPILRRRYPDLKILMLSMHTHAEYVREALRRGANGFLPKDTSPETLRVALAQVLSGKPYVSPEMLPALAAMPAPDAQTGPVASLSPRQRQLLDLIGQGHSTREMATLLGIGVKTVETHRARLMQALDLRHSNDLMRFAVQHQARQTPSPTSGR